VTALALVLGTGCADDVSPAVRIGDTTISDDELFDEVAEWAGNPVAIDPSVLAGSSPGTYPLELVRQLLQQRIDFELHNQAFEELGLELDDRMRDDALGALFGDPAAAEQAFEAFSDEFAQRFTDDFARQVALESELGPNEYQAWRADAYADADIEVSPRFGTWDVETAQITPPEGPIGSATTAPPFGA
jgi:hypothetical protein